MFRKTRGAILCPSCGRLTNADAPVCLACGRRNPGMWGFAGPLRMVFRSLDFTNAVTVACIALYIVSLVFDPRAALRPRGMLGVFSPSLDALLTLGAAGAIPWELGRWWTLLTAIYLHGGLLHILFNVLWIRQLGPAVQEVYGPARLVVIFTVAGVVGFVASNTLGVPFTIGASGSIFGLLSDRRLRAQARRRVRPARSPPVRPVGRAPLRARILHGGREQLGPRRGLRWRVRRRVGALAGGAAGRDCARLGAGLRSDRRHGRGLRPGVGDRVRPLTDAGRKDARVRDPGVLEITPAATYSPTPLPAQYHRPWRA